MRFRLLTLLLFLNYYVIWAQTVEGVITDETSQPIEYVNVLLYSLPDSSFVTGVVTDKYGHFTLSFNEKLNYFIKVSCLGYKSQNLSPTKNMAIILEEEPRLLGEVKVIGKRKVLKIENGSYVASVKNTVLESLPTLSDIIVQLPFVFGENGSFQVLGKGKPLIYINNRLVYESKEVAQLSPTDIDKIEVITSPGAKYDSSVGAVIRIHTVKAIGDGLSGHMNISATQRSTFSTNENATLNYRTGAWDIFGSIALDLSRQKQSSSFTQEYFKKGLEQQQNSNSDERYKYNSVIPLFGVNYSPCSAHSMGFRYMSNISTNRSDIWNVINVISSSSQYQLNQSSVVRNKSNSHSINAYYSGVLSDRLLLDVNTDWIVGHAGKGQVVHYKDKLKDSLLTDALSDYSLYAVKGVLSYHAKYGTIEAGGEYSYTKYLQSYNLSKPELGIDNTKDNSLQNRFALFSSYHLQKEGWAFSVGLRYEDIRFSYFFNGFLNKEQSRAYRKLFPNISIAYSGQNTQVSLSFDRKVKYPTYGDLRSNVQYSTPFLYESGNPTLLPTISNSFTTLGAWKDVQVMVSYVINENDILQVIRNYEDKPIMMNRPENIEKTRNASVGISYAPVIGLWRPQLVVSGMWQWLELNSLEELGLLKKPLFSTVFQNTFSFPGNWILRAGIMWNSSGYRGITYGKHSWQINFRLSKSFFQQRLWINLTINDILKTSSNQWKVHFDDLRITQKRNEDSRYVMLTASYRFNSTKSKYKGKQSSDELNRL